MLSLLPRYRESQLSLAVMLWLSGVVVDRTFTLGGVDMSARLFVDHRHINALVCMLKFSWLVSITKIF